MEHYEIQVVGHVDQRRADALGCERLQLLPDGRSVLTFAAIDQAALYGLLGRLRDAGLELIAAGRIAGSASPKGGAGTSRDRRRRDADQGGRE
jgi:hypothetical protein